MAKPERLPGGFELANGRAADRVSEKEAEAGRSRRRGRTASAAASPWHGPGLRLQRLHKAAFLGAAVSLLVRGRWEAGPRPLRWGGGALSVGIAWSCCPDPPTHAPRPPPACTLVPLRSESGRAPPAPAPPTGAGLLPLTGGPLLTWPHQQGALPPPPLLPSGRASPSSLWAETGPFQPAGGWSSFLSPPTETGLAPSFAPAGGPRPVRLALPGAPWPGGYLGRAPPRQTLSSETASRGLPPWLGRASLVQRASLLGNPALGSLPQPGVEPALNSDTKIPAAAAAAPLEYFFPRPSRSCPLAAPFASPRQPPLLPPPNAVGLLGCLFCRERPFS